MNLQDLSSLLTIKDGGCFVDIHLGWKSLATISEEDGKWFIDSFLDATHMCRGREYETKEAAFNAFVSYFKDS